MFTIKSFALKWLYFIFLCHCWIDKSNNHLFLRFGGQNENSKMQMILYLLSGVRGCDLAGVNVNTELSVMSRGRRFCSVPLVSPRTQRWISYEQLPWHSHKEFTLSFFSVLMIKNRSVFLNAMGFQLPKHTWCNGH